MNIFFSVIFILCSAILTKFFCVIAKNSRLVDKPNDRSLHSNPTVRGGGLFLLDWL